MNLEQILTFWAPELNPVQRNRLIKEIEKYERENYQIPSPQD